MNRSPMLQTTQPGPSPDGNPAQCSREKGISHKPIALDQGVRRKPLNPIRWASGIARE
ncbi:MAG: hypothetical protein HY287_04620 [Planctomycetes bacterium]|nr:hypothetical protein [Planctomycetota bacterium]MBI3833598.1 hypothetical protein [Planctomycetota bacterium]